MPMIQAQIFYHGEPLEDGLKIGEVSDVIEEIDAIGAWPLNVLIEARKFADEQNIKQVLGEPTQDMSEFKQQYTFDANSVEVFVDPHEFLQAGTDCMAHRYILVKPMSVNIEDMPPLVTTED